MVRILRFRATSWHYNLAQFYGPGYVVVKIRWDELSHMGVRYTQGCVVMVPCQWGH